MPEKNNVTKGYNMTPDELRALQLVELELLVEVDRILVDGLRF